MTSVTILGIDLLPPSSYSSSTTCSQCGYLSPSSKSNNCHLCGNTFCKRHLVKTRPEPLHPGVLHPFCEKCERSFLNKIIFDEFTEQKNLLEQEIIELKAQETHLDREILVKRDAIEGIRHSKDILIEQLTNNALQYGQEIEKQTEENKQMEKELQTKTKEKESLMKEIEKVEVLIKESNESPEETVGYEYIWGDGLLKRKEIETKQEKFKWNEGISGCCRLRKCC